jgi:hypothetical protein|tara:strand:+ start:756 stop:1166 length:411 start_codon:yes stop_codon:yes gene_type:complete
MKKIHHIGIVSDNLDFVLNALDLNKSKIEETIDDKTQQNFLHLIRLEQNDPWIEIIIPKNKESTVYNFSTKFKMGLHHIGILCDNIKEIESKFDTNTDIVKLGKYELTVESFGGKISTLFIANQNMITEYVEIKNE